MKPYWLESGTGLLMSEHSTRKKALAKAKRIMKLRLTGAKKVTRMPWMTSGLDQVVFKAKMPCRFVAVYGPGPQLIRQFDHHPEPTPASKLEKAMLG